MKVGPNGAFIVQVDGVVVAEKSHLGFPTEEQIVDAVAKALNT